MKITLLTSNDNPLNMVKNVDSHVPLPSDSFMEYYLHKDGQKYGPYDEATIRSMLNDQQIFPTDLVWNEQMPNWATVESIFPAPTPTPGHIPIPTPAPVVVPVATTTPVAPVVQPTAARAEQPETKPKSDNNETGKKTSLPKIAGGVTGVAILAGLIWFFLFRGSGSPFEQDNPDHQAIEAAIRKTLAKPQGSLTEEDFLKVKKLNLSGKKLKEISPLTRLTALEELNLTENNLENVEPLSALKSLKSLALSGNQLSDLKHIEALKNMETLDVSGNQISDISLLGGMSGLKDLRIGGNKITDVQPLASFAKLESLDAGANQISKTTPLAGLKNLQMLNLGNNQVKEIESFQNLKSLQILVLEGNPIDAKAIETLKKTLKGCQIIF